MQRIRPVGFWPLFTGSFRDYSGNGNHAVPAGGHWVSSGDTDGYVVTSAAQRATVPDSPELQTKGKVSIFTWGDNRLHALATVVAKSDGGGTDYEFYTDPAAGGLIAIWDGAGVSSFAHNVVGSTSLAVTMSNGEVPAFSVDGAFVGNGGAAAVVTPNDAPLDLGALYIGNPWNNPLYGVLIYTDILTPAEITLLHAWCLKQATPRHRNDYRNGRRADNIQLSRVSIDDEEEGHLSNTDYLIDTGDWQIQEDDYGRYIECINQSMLRRPSKQINGRWKFRFAHIDGTARIIFFADVEGRESTGNQYYLEFTSSPTRRVSLKKTIAGSASNIFLGNTGINQEGIPYDYEIERDASDQFSVWISGGEYKDRTLIPTIHDNPAVEATNQICNYVTCWFQTGDKLYLDEGMAL